MNKSEDLKSFAKKNLRGIYNFASAFRYGLNISKERQLSEKITNSTHDTNVSVDSPLKIIVVNSGPKRLNIVFKDFPKDICENKKRADFLMQAIIFANTNHFALRIISRNNQINPRYFKTFLKKNSLSVPDRYDFYTDSATRISSPVRRLDISKNDVIFTENDIINFKKWIISKTR